LPSNGLVSLPLAVKRASEAKINALLQNGGDDADD
jgi:hypothetical protein